MKKLIQEAKYDVICDICGLALENQFKNDVIVLIKGDTEYNFCSNECLIKFINVELQKESR